MKSKKKYAEKYAGITPNDGRELEDRHKKVLEIFSKQTFKKSLIENAAQHKFERILDIGCGDGNFSVLLKEASGAKEVYGIEISEKGVESAKSNGVKAYQLDIDEDDFPFEDNYFDTIFAGEVIEHLFDPDHFLDEIYRTLREEGLLVLSTPNLASIHNRIALLFGFQPFPMGVSARYNMGRVYEPNGESAQSLDHIRVLTLRSLKALLKMHRFTITSVKGSCAMLPGNMKFLRLFEAVDKVFTVLPGLSYRTIVVSKKE